MKGPICNICVNSDIFCMACRKKIDSGEVKDIDIKVLRALNDLSGNFKPLSEIELKKVIEGERLLVLVTKKGDAPVIVGKKGVMIKKLSRILGKQIRVMEESKDLKNFVEKLITPVPVIGINVVYNPEGEMLKVMIPKGRRIPMSKTSFSEIIDTVFGKKAVVSSA